jgi:rhodanese-related sulfurtransferase
MDGQTEVPEIGVSDVAAQLGAGAVLLDVREEVEWQAGRAESAHHIPLGELGQRHLELDAKTPVLVICRSGSRSARAVTALRGAGYEAYNVAGGMKAWAEAGHAIEPESGFVA